MTGRRDRGLWPLLVGQAMATALAIAAPYLAGRRPTWWQWLIDGVLCVAIGWTWGWVRQRRGPRPLGPSDYDEVRPRFGILRRGDTGAVVSLVFHPDPDKPSAFIGVDAGTEKPVELRPGDSLTVDVLGAGQTVRLAGQR